MNTTRLAPLAALIALAAFAPNASAATERYAAPTGSGTACSSGDPCGIRQAVEGASAGDEVVVLPGDYPLTGSTLIDPAKITIRGVPGQPRPRLQFSGYNQAGLFIKYGSLLRYVEVDQTAAVRAISTTHGARLDRVVAKGTGYVAETVSLMDATIRDSLVIAAGNAGRALVAGGGGAEVDTIRNVTAIAGATEGIAIKATTTGAANTTTIDATNVIARGGPGGADLKAVTDSSGAHADINVTHSNFGTELMVGTQAAINDGGGNQSVLPHFVAAAAGDYRQALGSPTIDAGLDASLNGAFDVDGDPRRLGKSGAGTTDIGADEFVNAPAAATAPAGAVTGHAATLKGSVTARGMDTSYHFQYGRSTAYDHATPTVDVGGGLSAVAAAATVSGLRAGTTYHYRLVAANAGGVTKTADRTFTTVAPPVHTGPAPFAGVKLASARLRLRGRSVMLKLTCPASTVGACAGRATLKSRKGARIGRARFSIAPGARAVVKLRVTRAGRRLPRGRLVIVAHDGAGRLKTTTRAVTIRHGR
jgi:hypothetical protein